MTVRLKVERCGAELSDGPACQILEPFANEVNLNIHFILNICAKNWLWYKNRTTTKKIAQQYSCMKKKCFCCKITFVNLPYPRNIFQPSCESLAPEKLIEENVQTLKYKKKK